LVARLGEGGLISGSETCTVAQVRRKSLRGW